MSITYPIELPDDPAPARVDWAGDTATAFTESEFTFSREVFENTGTRLAATVIMPKMRYATGARWVATLLSLYGHKGTFLFGPPAVAVFGTLGNPQGTPVVDGAGHERAKTLPTRGWTPSAAGVLRAGDWFGLGSGATARLYRVLADVNADGDGEAGIEVFPRIRGTLVDGEALELDAPVGLFQLGQRSLPWSEDEALHHGLTFPIIEAL